MKYSVTVYSPETGSRTFTIKAQDTKSAINKAFLIADKKHGIHNYSVSCVYTITPTLKETTADFLTSRFLTVQ